jgi:hypothetical protein
VSEAYEADLAALVPKAVLVLRAHLGEGDQVNPDAWRAALSSSTPSAAHPSGPKLFIEMPQTEEEVRALSWPDLQAVAERLLADLPTDAMPITTHSTAVGKPTRTPD